jgi:hypothetical protein
MTVSYHPYPAVSVDSYRRIERVSLETGESWSIASNKDCTKQMNHGMAVSREYLCVAKDKCCVWRYRILDSKAGEYIDFSNPTMPAIHEDVTSSRFPNGANWMDVVSVPSMPRQLFFLGRRNDFIYATTNANKNDGAIYVIALKSRGSKDTYLAAHGMNWLDKHLGQACVCAHQRHHNRAHLGFAQKMPSHQQVRYCCNHVVIIIIIIEFQFCTTTLGRWGYY